MKPKPPKQSVISDDIKKLLKELGADIDLDSLKTKEDKVYDALVECWKGKRTSPPSIKEIASEAKATPGSVNSILSRLVNRGKAIRLSTGIYIPAV